METLARHQTSLGGGYTTLILFCRGIKFNFDNLTEKAGSVERGTSRNSVLPSTLYCLQSISGITFYNKRFP